MSSQMVPFAGVEVDQAEQAVFPGRDRHSEVGPWRPFIETMPSLEAASLARQQWLLCVRESWSLTLMGEEIDVEFAGLSPADIDGEPFPLSVGPAFARLTLDAGLWNMLLQSGAGGLDWTSLPEPYRRLALIEILEPLLADLQAVMGRSVSLAAGEHSIELQHPYRFRLKHGEHALGCLDLAVSGDLCEPLDEGIDRLFTAKTIALENIPIKAFVRLGEMSLPMSEYSTLRIGDLLLLPISCRADRELMLLLDESTIIKCEMEMGRARVLTITERESEKMEESDLMVEDIPGEDNNTGPAEEKRPIEPQSWFDPKQLPVHVTFDLADITLSVGELAALQPGSILELDRQVTDLVSVRANGRIFGHGELMRLEDRLGIRLTRVNNDG